MYPKALSSSANCSRNFSNCVPFAEQKMCVPSNLNTALKQRYTTNIYVACVAYSLKAKIVESKQLAFARQWPINKNRVMVFSVQFMLMAVYATVEYFMSPLSNSLYCYRRTMFSMRYMPVIQVHNELSQVP